MGLIAGPVGDVTNAGTSTGQRQKKKGQTVGDYVAPCWWQWETCFIDFSFFRCSSASGVFIVELIILRNPLAHVSTPLCANTISPFMNPVNVRYLQWLIKSPKTHSSTHTACFPHLCLDFYPCHFHRISTMSTRFFVVCCFFRLITHNRKILHATD